MMESSREVPRSQLRGDHPRRLSPSSERYEGVAAKPWE
jgi:hypothetical protein